VVGSGFDAYEGETARAVVIYGSNPGYGLAQTTVRNGSFTIAMPKTNEPYTGYAVYIDRGRDNACTVNVDPFFQIASGGNYEDLNWAITPQTTFLRGLPPCSINALFDLTQPLICTSGTGGSAGSGGTGTGDDAGLPDAGDADRILEQIQIVEGKIDGGAYHNLRFVGTGLEQYEGDVVTFRIGSMTGTWRVGYGQVRIAQGAFDVLFPDVVAAVFEQKQAWIDANGNGLCDAGELLFLDSGLQDMDATLTFTPTAVQVRAAQGGTCTILNSWTAPQP